MYDKKQSSFYCEKEFAEIARHYQQVHGDEEEVKLAVQYPANDERRKLQFELKNCAEWETTTTT